MHTDRTGLALSTSLAVVAAILVLLAPVARGQDAGVSDDAGARGDSGALDRVPSDEPTEQTDGPNRAPVDDPCNETRSGARSRAVRITVWKTSDDTRALVGVIRELLDDLPVVVCPTAPRPVHRDLVLHRRKNVAPALARVFLAKRRGHIELYVVDGPWERVVARRLALGQFGVDTVTREQVGQIVMTTIETLLAGEPIGQRRQELIRQQSVSPSSSRPEEKEPEASASAPAARDGEWHVGLLYAGRLQGSRPVAHEFGVAGGWIGPRRPVALTVGAAINYVWSHTARNNDVRVELRGVRALVDVGATVFLGRGIRLEPAVGIGVETTFVRPSVMGDATLSARKPSSHPRPIGAGSLALRFRPTGWSSVAIGLDVAVHFEDVHYVVQDVDADRVVGDPWSARPGAWLALGFVL